MHSSDKQSIVINATIGCDEKRESHISHNSQFHLLITEVKHDCVRSETGQATFQMNDQNGSLRRPSEGMLN